MNFRYLRCLEVQDDLPASARPAEPGEVDRILDLGRDFVTGHDPSIRMRGGQNQPVLLILIQFYIRIDMKADSDKISAVVAGGCAARSQKSVETGEDVALLRKGKFALMIKPEGRNIAVMAGNESLYPRFVDTPAGNTSRAADKGRARKVIDLDGVVEAS